MTEEKLTEAPDPTPPPTPGITDMAVSFLRTLEKIADGLAGVKAELAKKNKNEATKLEYLRRKQKAELIALLKESGLDLETVKASFLQQQKEKEDGTSTETN